MSLTAKRVNIPIIFKFLKIDNISKSFLNFSLFYFFFLFKYNLKTLFLTNFYLGFKDEVLIYQLIASFCVIVGHVFPVFANFRGGKGVATTLGIILAINLDTALISLAIFLIVFMLTSYVSLGAIIASVVFPFISFFAMKEDARIMIIFSILVALIVLFSHRKNINRLMRGEENKMNFFGRKA